MSKHPFTLIGEEIAGAWNALALTDTARAFGGDYLAYDASNPAPHNVSDTAEAAPDEDISAPPPASPLDAFGWLLAAENQPGAQSIYDCRPPVVISTEAAGQTFTAAANANCRRALIVGNEAKGLRRRTLKRADAVAEIPLVSQNINCLNVAAAASVMLYYLAVNEARMAAGDAPLGQKRQTLTAVQKARPDVLLIGGRDPMELGSAIRSACAFGWERVFLDDRHNAWYACDRLMKSEGRGAARRGRNPIKVIPFAPDLPHAYDTLVVVTRTRTDRPLYAAPLANRSHYSNSPNPDGSNRSHRSNHSSGSAQNVLLVLADEQDANDVWNPPAGLQAGVVYAALPPIADALYHYRQAASIALAETARQLGLPDGNGIYLRGRKQRYQKTVTPTFDGICVDTEDLCVF